MRFFTALIALAIASVELGVLAAPAAQPNVNGLSKNAVVKPKAAHIASTKTAKRKTRRATVNNAVAPPPAALGPISTEKVTVIVHQLASDGRDPDDDGQDGDNDDAGDADTGDSDEAGDADEAGGDDEVGDDEAGDDEAGDDEAGDDEAGDDEAGDDEAGDDEAGDDDNDNDDDP